MEAGIKTTGILLHPEFTDKSDGETIRILIRQSQKCVCNSNSSTLT